MPTILPPPSSPQSLPTAAPAQVIVTVSNPPAALAQLPPGTLVRAEILQVLARGLAEIQTDYGTAQIRSNVALGEGAKLELQLLRTSPQLQLSIRAIEGQPVATGGARVASSPASTTAQNAPGASTEGAGGSSAPAASTASTSSLQAVSLPHLAIGSLVRGTVLRGLSNAGERISAGRTPPVAAQNATTAATNSTASQPATGSGAASPPLVLVTGTNLNVRIVGLNPAAPVQSAAATLPAMREALTGTVSAFSSNGRPIVETPLGILSLDASTELPVGTQIQLSIVPPRVGTGVPLIPTGVLDELVQNHSWPALEQAVTALAQRTDDASQAMSQALPQPNRQLGATLLLFLSALKSGDTREWLGDAMSILERDRPDLANRLHDDFSQIARAFNDSPQQDWRTAVLPFFTGSQLEPVQMHIRGGKPQRGEKEGEEGSRFIIDIVLSRLGRVQLDGFVKKRGEDAKRRFDLIVRTETRLSRSMHRDIHRIFNDFSEAAGLVGALSFQAQGAFIEVAMPRVGSQGPNGLVV